MPFTFVPAKGALQGIQQYIDSVLHGPLQVEVPFTFVPAKGALQGIQQYIDATLHGPLAVTVPVTLVPQSGKPGQSGTLVNAAKEKQALDEVESHVRTFSDHVGAIFNGIRRVGYTIFAVDQIAQLAKGVFDFFTESNAKMEQWTGQYVHLLGTQEAATRRIAEVQQAAIRTPFTLDDLVKVDLQLQAVGIHAKSYFTAITDAATALKDRVPDALSVLTSAFTRIRGGQVQQALSRGPLETQLGISPEDLIANQGLKFDGRRYVGSVKEALDGVAAELERRWGGFAETQDRTLTGMESNIRNFGTVAKRDLTAPFTEAFKDLVALFGDPDHGLFARLLNTGALDNFRDHTYQVLSVIGGLFKQGFGLIGSLIDGATTSFERGSPAALAYGAAIIGLTTVALAPLSSVLGPAAEKLAAFAASMLEFVAPIAPFIAIAAAIGLVLDNTKEGQKVWSGFKSDLEGARPALDEIGHALGAVATGVKALFVDLSAGDLTRVFKDLQVIGEAAFIAIATAAETYYGRIVPAALRAVGQVGQIFAGLATDALVWGANLVTEFAGGMARAAGAIIDAINNAIIQPFRNFLEGHSPPKMGPLKDIHIWGQAIIDTYLAGMDSADFTVLDKLTTTIKNHLQGLAGIGQIDQTGIIPRLLGDRQTIEAVLNRLRDGMLSVDEAAQTLSDRLAPEGPEIQAIAQALVHQTDLERQIVLLKRDEADLNEKIRDKTREIRDATAQLKDAQKAEDPYKQQIAGLDRILDQNKALTDSITAQKDLATGALTERLSGLREEHDGIQANIDLVRAKYDVELSGLEEVKSRLQDQIDAEDKATLGKEAQLQLQAAQLRLTDAQAKQAALKPGSTPLERNAAEIAVLDAQRALSRAQRNAGPEGQQLRDVNEQIRDTRTREGAELAPLNAAQQQNAAAQAQLNAEILKASAPYTKQLDLLKEQRLQLESHRALLQAQVSLIESSLQPLKDRLATLNDQKTALDDQKTVLDDQLTTLTDQKSAYDDVITRAQDRLKAEDTTNSLLKEQADLLANLARQGAAAAKKGAAGFPPLGDIAQTELGDIAKPVATKITGLSQADIDAGVDRLTGGLDASFRKKLDEITSGWSKQIHTILTSQEFWERAGGALTGGVIGSVFGPWGIAIGAGIGASIAPGLIDWVKEHAPKLLEHVKTLLADPFALVGGAAAATAVTLAAPGIGELAGPAAEAGGAEVGHRIGQTVQGKQVRAAIDTAVGAAAGGAGDVLGGLAEGAGKALAPVDRLLEAIGPRLENIWLHILKPALGDLGKIWSEIVQGALQVVQVFDPLGDRLGKFYDAVVEPIASRVAPTIGTLVGIIGTVVTAIGGAGGAGLMGTLAGLIEVLKIGLPGAFTLVSGVLDTFVVGPLKFLLDGITGMVKVVGDILAGDWSKAWTDAKTLVSDLAGDILGIVTGLVTTLPRAVIQIVTGILNQFGALDGVKQLIAGPFNEAMTLLGDILDGIVKAINWVITKLGAPAIGLPSSVLPHIAIPASHSTNTGTNYSPERAGGGSPGGGYNPNLQVGPPTPAAGGGVFGGPRMVLVGEASTAAAPEVIINTNAPDKARQWALLDVAARALAGGGPGPRPAHVPGTAMGLGDFFDGAVSAAGDLGGGVVSGLSAIKDRGTEALKQARELLKLGAEKALQAGFDAFHVNGIPLPVPLTEAGSGLWGTIKAAALDAVKALFGGVSKSHLLGGNADATFGGGAIGGLRDRQLAADWIQEAADILGLQLADADMGALLYLMSRENPDMDGRSNPTPVGSEHATGVMQTLPSTFAAYALAGHGNISNPIDNIIASLRYQLATYGSLQRAAQNEAAGAPGYAAGTRSIGQTGLYTMHTGEMVTPQNNAGSYTFDLGDSTLAALRGNFDVLGQQIVVAISGLQQGGMPALPAPASAGPLQVTPVTFTGLPTLTAPPDPNLERAGSAVSEMLGRPGAGLGGAAGLLALLPGTTAAALAASGERKAGGAGLGGTPVTADPAILHALDMIGRLTTASGEKIAGAASRVELGPVKALEDLFPQLIEAIQQIPPAQGSGVPTGPYVPPVAQASGGPPKTVPATPGPNAPQIYNQGGGPEGVNIPGFNSLSGAFSGADAAGYIAGTAPLGFLYGFPAPTQPTFAGQGAGGGNYQPVDIRALGGRSLGAGENPFGQPGSVTYNQFNSPVPLNAYQIRRIQERAGLLRGLQQQTQTM